MHCYYPKKNIARKLVGLNHIGLWILVVPILTSAQPDTLRKLAELRGIYVGAAVTSKADLRTPEYDSTLSRNFNGVVAENAMKFWNVSRDARGVYNFAIADAIADFARDHGMKLRGHTLVWHTSTPTWFNNLSGLEASRDTTLKIMRSHIETVVGRYKGRIYEWDVVNEAIAPTGGPSPNYRTEPTARWDYRVGGIDYVDSAFKWAHMADTNALLFYNDFGGESMNQKSQNIYDLVTGLKSRGAPIHGVGLQCHFALNGLDTAAIGRNMRRLAELGFLVSLTEVDVEASNNAANLATQKERYKALMKLCLSIPACKTFYVWGLNDAQSYRGVGAAALLFSGTSTLTPKPAYWGLVEALAEGSTATSTPSAPWNVVVSSFGKDSLAVQWMAPVTDGRSRITGYKAMAIADTNMSCTTDGRQACVVHGLGIDTNHRFTVRAYNAVGASGKSPPSTRASGPITIQPPEPPTPPVTSLVPEHRASIGRFKHPYSYQLAASVIGSVDRMTMSVANTSGVTVWSKSVSPSSASLNEISWNGRTGAGIRAPAGVYIIRVRVEKRGHASEFFSTAVLRGIEQY